MSNITVNRVSTTLTATEQTNLNTIKANYVAAIDSKCVTLTKDQADGLKGVDVKNLVFCQRTVKANDAEGVAMLPPSIAAIAPELVKDVTFFDQLDTEEKWLEGRLLKIRQTKKVIADEMYNGGLKCYGIYETLAAAGVPGAQARYDQLKYHFEDNGAGRPPIDER